MAEGASPGPEVASAVSTAGSVKSEGPGVINAGGERSPQRPWNVAPEYDPKRAQEYEVKEEGSYNVFTDPATGREVARVLRVAGGGFLGRGGKKPSDEQPAQTAQTGAENQGATESPIPGLTNAEVQLFEAHGISVADLIAVRTKFGQESFLDQAKMRLEGFRAEQTTKEREVQLTPEQKTQQEAEGKAQRIEKLKKEYQDLQGKQSTNPREKRYIQMRKANIERELAYAEGGGKGPPETAIGSEKPEDLPEWIEDEASPERGRQIVAEINKLEVLVAAGKYREVDWERLKQLYMDHLIHTEACRLMMLRVSPAALEISTSTLPEAKKVSKDLFYDPEIKNEAGESRPFKPASEWLEEWRQGRITDMDRFRKEAEVYFAEAENVGLLRDLKVKLVAARRDVRQGILRGLTSDEIMLGSGSTPGVEQAVQGVLNTWTRALRNRLRVDAEAYHLAGVGELYAQLALDRFADTIVNEDAEGITQEDYLTHEFQLTQEGDEEPAEETYWRLEHGWYITIFAQTPDEFMTAADSFLSRLELITAAPEKIFQDATQFIDVLYKSEGAKKLLGNEKTKDFIPNLILGMEARIGMFGADNSNERYEAESYKKFLDFINKDAKGSERWLELMKLMDGNIAAAVWSLDKDPRRELLFSLHGSRGQLAESSYAQRDKLTNQGLYNQLYEEFVEEMLGVQIKNKDNVGLVNRFMTDRVFVSMFEGLYRYSRVPEGRQHGDANVRAYQEALANAPDGRLTRAQSYDRKIRLGRIQLDLQDIRAKILKGEELRKRNGRLYDPLKDDPTDLLEKETDANFYKREFSKARKAVDIALQIYGTTGDKSKRGGGVFTISKLDDEGNEYQDYVPVHLAEKFIQCGETMVKMQYADDAAIWETIDPRKDYFARQITAANKAAGKSGKANFKAQYRTKMCELGRKRHTAELQKHGFEAKLHDVDYDANGNEIAGSRRVMKIKRPKENPAATDDLELARDARGNVIKGQVIKDGKIINEILIDENGKVTVEEIEADFYNATHHPYANWSGHTYWSYQEEHRHLLLSARSFKEARQIRDGELRWEDADPVSVQLLILDPTLKRVKRFEGNQFVEREGKLTMAAVEDSYQSHWRITRELYEAFWPKYGTPTSEIGVYYGLQDFGGFRKMVEHMRARFAENPERFMRRGRRLLPYLHNPIAALSEYMGQGSVGALETIRMMGYGTYRLVGTLALDKFSANAEAAKRAYDYLEGYTDREGKFVEGLLLKLTNNSDKLSAVVGKIPLESLNWEDPHAQNEFCYALMDSLGRLQIYEHLMTVMETRIRNASGALWLEGVDILTADEQIDPEIERKFAALPMINANLEYQYTDPDTGEVKTATRISRADLARFIKESYEYEVVSVKESDKVFNEALIDEGSTSTNTGSGRHSAWIFHDIFGKLLVDEEKRGGVDLYPGEKLPYSRIFDKIIIVPPKRGRRIETEETIWKFIFGKFVPT